MNQAELIAKWLGSYQSKQTQHVYGGSAERFCRTIGKPIADLQRKDLTEWREHLTCPSTKSIRREISTVRSLLSFAYKNGYISENVSDALILPKDADKQTDRYLSQQDVLAIIERNKDDEFGHLLLRFLYQTGVRAAELAALRWRDIEQLADGANLTIHGKGERVRAVKIGAQLWSDLQRIQGASIGDSDALVFGLQSNFDVLRTVKKLTAKAGFSDVTTHFFRHSAATHAIQKGMHPESLSARLGHIDWKSTQCYIHLATQESAHRISQDIADFLTA